MPAANTPDSPVRRCLDQMRFIFQAGQDLLGRIKSRVQHPSFADAPRKLIRATERRLRRLARAVSYAAILAGKLLADPTYRGEPAKPFRPRPIHAGSFKDRRENLFPRERFDHEDLDKILDDELRHSMTGHDKYDDVFDGALSARSRRRKPQSFESRFAGMGIGQIMERIRRDMGSTTQVGPWFDATLDTPYPYPGPPSEPPPTPPFTLSRRVWRSFFNPPQPKRGGTTGPP